jgi:hypothetical protein
MLTSQTNTNNLDILLLVMRVYIRMKRMKVVHGLKRTTLGILNTLLSHYHMLKEQQNILKVVESIR